MHEQFHGFKGNKTRITNEANLCKSTRMSLIISMKLIYLGTKKYAKFF